jgi:hypothetical protein
MSNSKIVIQDALSISFLIIPAQALDNVKNHFGSWTWCVVQVDANKKQVSALVYFSDIDECWKSIAT